jgi:hypothetical protein
VVVLFLVLVEAVLRALGVVGSSGPDPLLGEEEEYLNESLKSVLEDERL